MIDYAKVILRAGNGGRGITSFLREKFRPKGGPDGGDGGKGGDIIIEASDQLSTLLDFQYQHTFQAENGVAGGARHMHGKDGADLVILVPTGSIIKVNRIEREIVLHNKRIDDHESPVDYRQKVINYKKIAKQKRHSEYLASRQIEDQQSIMRENIGEISTHLEPDSQLASPSQTYLSSDQDLEPPIYDLTRNGQRLLIARGGQGGRGNDHFKSATHQTPQESERGQKGEILEIEIQLKMIAQVGIIGLPNAGKSSLLKAITSATPKVGNYPFTTLDPNLGVLEKPTSLRLSQDDTSRLVLADVPGIIEGANQGKGLGLQFLQHLERTVVLLHLIGIPEFPTSFTPQEVAIELVHQYQVIRNELTLYRKGLESKDEILVINKLDLLPDEQRVEYIKAIEQQFSQHSVTPIFISAHSGQGLNGLVKILFDHQAAKQLSI